MIPNSIPTFRRPVPAAGSTPAARKGIATALLLALLAAAWTLGASPAGAATLEIGAVAEVSAAAPPAGLTAGGFAVQAGEAAGTYAVPPGYETITSWSHSAGTTAGNLTFKVYRPTGAPKEYTAVASDTRAVTAGTVTAGAVQTFAVQIPVNPGDRIGLSSDDVELAFETSNPADRIGFFGIDVPLGTSRATDGNPFADYKLDVTATLNSIPGAAPGGPPAGGAPLPGQGPAAAASQRAVTSLRISPLAFRAARRGPSIRPAGRRTPAAAKVSYRVNVATKVRFEVRAVRAGRRTGRGASARCVAQTSRNRRAARCTREVRVSGSFTRTSTAGVNILRFTGRLGGRRLKPGSYRLVATPTPGGSAAQSAKRSFRIR